MTNYQLATKCLNLAQKYKTIYVMGCLGHNMTKNRKTAMYNHHEYNRRPERWKHINAAGDDRWGFDCVCMIKALVWGWCADKSKSRGGAIYESNGLSDVGANAIIRDTWSYDVTVIDSCKTYDWSKIKSGEVLWTDGHVGLYIGAGKVVHCSGAHANCVQMMDFSKMSWKKHGKLRCISYTAGNLSVVTGPDYKSSAANLASNPDPDCTYSDADGSVPGISPSVSNGSVVGNTNTVTNYKPRLSEPSADDKFWLIPSAGGVNKCLHIANGSVLPNCVGYAWGRFMEILGYEPSLSRSDAECWWDHEDGYQRGQTPKLGAVICWRKGVVGDDSDGSGHVAIVEQINSDGSIVTSESGYGASRRFWTTTRTNTNGNWGQGSAYTFQGFIYNPAVTGSFMLTPLAPVEDRLSYFLQAAQKLVGDPDYWKTIKDLLDNGKLPNGLNIQSQHDSIAYLLYCAKSVNGLLDVVIPEVSSCSAVGQVGVAKGLGFWHDGPGNGKSGAWAYPGDIVHLRTVHKTRSSKYSCEELGIVINVIENGTKFEAAVCRYGQGVKLVTYKLDSDQIAGYYRPDWKLVNASVLNLLGYVFGLSVYTEISSSQDSVMREVGYLNSRLEPSIRSSNLRLSVINYTSGISSLFLASGGGLPFGPNMQYNDLILEGFSSIQCSILEQLMSYGLNAAVSIGILANINHESSFRPDAVGDGGTSFGLCQWHLGRGDAMKRHCGGGDRWKTNVTGQISYLWYEITQTSERAIMPYLERIPNTLQGAMDAAETWCRRFERPGDPDRGSAIRRATASTYWNTAVTQLL